MSKYTPQLKSQKMLDFAMDKIKSVPYRVSARWVFYRLFQAGFYGSKKDVATFDRLISRVRKNFWNGWHPNVLTDTIRQCYWKGEFDCRFGLQLDTIEDQDFYVQIWFEAQAMHQQFEYYTNNYRVSLVPFRGDCSIPIKWEIAKKIEEITTKYGKPVKVLYYGDYDVKGVQIYQSALKDIRAWCNVPFDVERIGLTLQQAKDFGIPENPLKPNAYQWEALTDEQAKKLILEGVTKFLHEISPTLQKKEDGLKAEVTDAIMTILHTDGVVD